MVPDDVYWRYTTVFDKPRSNHRLCRMLRITSCKWKWGLCVCVCFFSRRCWFWRQPGPSVKQSCYVSLCVRRTFSPVTCSGAADMYSSYSGEKAMSLDLEFESLHCMQGLGVQNKQLLMIANMGVSHISIEFSRGINQHRCKLLWRLTQKHCATL